MSRLQGRRQGIADGKPAAIAFVHLGGSALNLHPHTHVVVPDGLFVDEGGKQLRFHPLDPPTDEQVARIALRVHHRAERMFDRELFDANDLEDSDALAADLLRATAQPVLFSRDDDEWEHPVHRSRRCAVVDGY